MNNFKRKVPPFILGLLLGISIAGTFFILRLDNYFKELTFYKNLATTFHYQNHSNNNTTKKTKPNSMVSIAKKDTVFIKDTARWKQSNTQNPASQKDSAVKQTMNTIDNITIRQDVLITTKTTELQNLDIQIKTHQDSLLEKVSNIKDTRPTGKQFMQIEFWKSPLNYKGYKLSKYTVILYGLTDTPSLKIYSLDDVLFLKQGNVVYKLNYNSDFRPLQQVLDEELLSNFN